ncbi:MAG TPA: hypothetical protein VF860_05985, partial [Candidatus Acidoferrales bacterium]
QTGKADRWLHVRVVCKDANGETVRVNVPLELAIKILPTINHSHLHGGRVQIRDGQINDVDLRALLDAVRSAKDGEFVTVQSRENDVRVAKQGGYLVVHVRDHKGDGRQRVEVRVPMTVVNALLSGGKDELDLVAALQALGDHPDTELVTVEDGENTVRIWLDSKNTAD